MRNPDFSSWYGLLSTLRCHELPYFRTGDLAHRRWSIVGHTGERCCGLPRTTAATCPSKHCVPLAVGYLRVPSGRAHSPAIAAPPTFCEA